MKSGIKKAVKDIKEKQNHISQQVDVIKESVKDIKGELGKIQ